jgi:type VI protein secretion system component VasK
MAHIVFAITALFLVAFALWFSYRQHRLLQKLRKEEPHLSPEDKKFFRRLVWRRWACNAVTILLAVMLGGLFGMGILDELDRLMELGATAKETHRKLTPEEEYFVRFAFCYTLVALPLTVFVWVALAVWDLMAIRRWGMRHRRRLREDRQAMLERQLPRLYQERRLRQGDNFSPPPDGLTPETPSE